MSAMSRQGRTLSQLREHFWTRVQENQETGCWEWQGSRNVKSGYGYLTAYAVFGRLPQPCHRVAWILTFGEIPDDLWVLHQCDNPPCVNPAHLFLGTVQDNATDKMAKGRHRYGVRYGEEHWTHKCPERVAKREKHGGAKLTATQVEEIRQLHRDTLLTEQEIADRYGISRPAVSAIITNRHWREENIWWRR